MRSHNVLTKGEVAQLGRRGFIVAAASYYHEDVNTQTVTGKTDSDFIKTVGLHRYTVLHKVGIR